MYFGEHGPLSQLVEKLTLNQTVEGSSPSRLTRLHVAGRSESADRKGATAEAIRGNLVGGAVVALMSALAAWEGTATGLLHDLVDAAPRAKLIVRDQYRRVLTA